MCPTFASVAAKTALSTRLALVIMVEEKRRCSFKRSVSINKLLLLRVDRKSRGADVDGGADDDCWVTMRKSSGLLKGEAFVV